MDTNHQLNPLLTVNQAAEYLAVVRTSVYRLLREDPDFPQPLRVGKRHRWRKEDLDRYLERDQK